MSEVYLICFFVLNSKLWNCLKVGIILQLVANFIYSIYITQIYKSVFDLKCRLTQNEKSQIHFIINEYSKCYSRLIKSKMKKYEWGR